MINKINTVNKKHLNTGKLALFLLLITFFVFSSLKYVNTADNKYISIENLHKSGKIKTSIISLGGYQEECIEFDLQNTTSDTLFVEIESGRRFVSKDTSIQDILLVKKKRFKIFPLKKKKLKGNGFCCQSSKKAPYKDAVFEIGYIAPKDWLKLTEVIDNNSFPSQAIQSAIWVLSDNHTISSIHDNDLNAIYKLRKIVADIKGVQIPWYTLTYKKDTTMLFSNRPNRILGEFKYRVKNNSVITISIRDKSGKIVKKLIKEEAKGPGEYPYKLDLDVLQWPKGKYSIFVYQDYSKLIARKHFVL